MRTLWNAMRAVAWTLWALVLVVLVWSLFLEPRAGTVTLMLWWLALPAVIWFWARLVTILDRYGR